MSDMSFRGDVVYKLLSHYIKLSTYVTGNTEHEPPR